MTIGVYQICNTITGACYIGASRNVESRWNGHRGNLRRGSHINQRLQSDWTLYGESAFAFTVIEVMASMKGLADRERFHAERIQSDNTIEMYSDSQRAGAGLLPDDLPSDLELVMVSLKISRGDIKRLDYIAKHQYPEEHRMVSRCVRRLIRQEYERIIQSRALPTADA